MPISATGGIHWLWPICAAAAAPGSDPGYGRRARRTGHTRLPRPAPTQGRSRPGSSRSCFPGMRVRISIPTIGNVSRPTKNTTPLALLALVLRAEGDHHVRGEEGHDHREHDPGGPALSKDAHGASLPESRHGNVTNRPYACEPLRSCGKLAHVTLTIALLGAPRIEVDGEPLRVDTRKAVALLAFLAVTGHAHGRDRLTGLLWPEYDDDRARAALRRTLSTLKTALGGDWLQHRPGDRRARCRGCRRRRRAFRELVDDTRGRAGRDRGADQRGRAASRRSARGLRAARQRRVRQLAAGR